MKIKPRLTRQGTDQACGDQAILRRCRFLPLILSAVKTVKHLSVHRSYIKRKTTNCCKLSGTNRRKIVVLTASTPSTGRIQNMTCLGLDRDQYSYTVSISCLSKLFESTLAETMWYMVSGYWQLSPNSTTLHFCKFSFPVVFSIFSDAMKAFRKCDLYSAANDP